MAALRPAHSSDNDSLARSAESRESKKAMRTRQSPIIAAERRRFSPEAAPSHAASEQADAQPLPRWGAFAYPNYRAYWLANLVRIFGIQFRFIGGLWLVQEPTAS